MIGLLGSMLGGRGGRMIGSMIGGRTGGMIGGLAGAFLGGSQLRRLGGLIPGRGDKDNQPGTGGPQNTSPIDDGEAKVLIRAMVNAAKADGHVDETERQLIMSELGDLSPQEQAFMSAELSAPMTSASAFAGSVPQELRAEAYAVSLVALNVDTMGEADYLRELSSALGLSDNDRNDIHDDLGADLL